jgi:DNA-binding response OmpR family regulator
MAEPVPLVLTVDDDPHLLAIIEHHVVEWGYAHRGVRSSAEMWRELERVIANVIILDVALGDAGSLKNGSRMCRLS